MFSLDNPWILPLAGLVCGIAVGVVARKQHFCTLTSLERYWYADDSQGVRTWALASAVALIFTQLLRFNANLDIDSSFYLKPEFNPISAVFGGLTFGFGMALVGTCGFGALVRLGGGSLRSLIILCTMGYAALVTSHGVLGQLRMLSDDNMSLDFSFAGSQSIADIVNSLTGLSLTLPIATLVFSLIVIWVFKSSSYRGNYSQQFTGLCIGVAVVFGWWATSSLEQHLFVDVQIESASFVLPPGEILMKFIVNTGRLPDYGMGLTIGVVIGSAITSILTKDVRWEACDSAQELGRHLVGAVLMGVGGVFALGCTIGQGVSAFSTMALSSFVVIASILLGARIGLSLLISGFPLFRSTSH